MLKITVTGADGKALSFEYPETMTHKVKGADHKIDLARVNEAGWRALLKKSCRLISDGSPDRKSVEVKLDSLYGIGKPLGERASRDPIAAELVALLVAKLGAKTGKFDRTLDAIRKQARERGVNAKTLTALVKHATAVAAIKAEARKLTV